MIEIFLDTGQYYSGEQYHNKGSIFGGIGVIDRDAPLELAVQINGQTLLETEPEVFTSGQFDIINHSGEMFISGFELKSRTGSYDLNGIDSLGYNYAGTGDRYFYRDDNNTVMWNGLVSLVGSTHTGAHVFLNGIKLVSGESYTTNAGALVWSDGDTSVTGVVFTIPQYPHTNSYYTGVYDLNGVKFNEFISYLNGQELSDRDFLKTSSIVECIETGLNPVVEFNLTREGTTIFL